MIVTICIMLALGVLMLFGSFFNPLIEKMFANNFKVVSNQNSLLVHYISVGNSDAIAINLPDGKVAFIDAGTGRKSVTVLDYVKNNVLLGNSNKIDYIFLTHTDEDHIGNAKKLIERYNVGTVYMPATEADTNVYTELKNYVENHNISTKEFLGATDIENGYKIEILGPVTVKKTDSNASCPIIKLTYKDTSFLFAGDVPTYTEQKYITEYGEQLDADILKVAHHGSKSSSSLDFLQKVTPDIAVISCGEGTTAEVGAIVLENLSKVGAQVVRTDKVGNIVIKVKDDLKMYTGDISITNLSLDYRNVLIIVEVVLGVQCLLIVVIKKKKVHKK
ncbi:MAG: MBL fold metallo-hydrolase [Clostridia bacterium]|nr:MBL fold metallo-hydrolase [Clostridia bacterium]